MSKSPFGKRGKTSKSTIKLVIDIVYYMFTVCCLWIAITSMIQRFKCPEMTDTQLFLNIPNSMMLNFNEEVEK